MLPWPIDATEGIVTKESDVAAAANKMGRFAEF
jgi:hypothetical protein